MLAATEVPFPSPRFLRPSDRVLILVANLGSTSFKYRLLDMSDERELARGAVDRIGEPVSRLSVSIGDWKETREQSVPDHGVAVAACLEQLTDPEHGVIQSAQEVAAIGFKAVHGGRLSGVNRVDANVLDAMAEMNAAAPAHNPPYIAAMRTLGERFPDLPMFAAFETGFHATIPASRRTYAIPADWTDRLQIRRYGFHGASHRYIGTRTAQLLGRNDAKIISCHLGGSSSITAIDGGKSVFTTMGMTPQTGLPQNNRVGDFDPFALPMIMEATGQTLEETLKSLASDGGLLGISGGVSADIRDLHDAAQSGNAQCQLAIDVYVQEIRRHIGGAMMALGGLDAIVFTGGIGENDAIVRAGVCSGLDSFGVQFDPATNEPLRQEGSFHAAASPVQLWVVPTNEELVVARQTVQSLAASHPSSTSQDS